MSSRTEFNLKLLLVLVITLACLQPTLAIKLSPAAHSLSTVSEEQTYSIQLTNDQSYPVRLSFSVQGDLAPDIRLPAPVEIPAGETRSVLVSVEYKERPPGYLEAQIIVEAKAVQQSTITASAAVAHVVRLRTPLEGKHIDSSLQYSAASINELVLFTIPVTNIGTEEINEVYATVLVDNKALQTRKTSLWPGDGANLVAEWTPFEARTYPVDVEVTFDGSKTKITGDVTVGILSASIMAVEAGPFQLGELFAIKVTALNEWINALPVNAQATIKQGSAEVIGQSTAVLLAAQSTDTIPIYLSSDQLVVGPANLSIAIKYGNRQTTQNYTVVIGVDSFTMISDVEPKEPKKSSISIAIAVVVLIIVVVAITTYLRTKRRRKS